MTKRFSRLRLVAGALVLTAVGAYACGLDRYSFYPTSRLAHALPWSAPLLRFWACYHNQFCRAQALQVMIDAGSPYREEAWERMLRQNPEAWSTEQLARSPGQPRLFETALAALDPDRGAEQQLAAVYLKLHRADWWLQGLARVPNEPDRRRRLLVLSLLADRAPASEGSVTFENDNPLSPEARREVQQRFHQDCQEAGLIHWERHPAPSKPDPATAAPTRVYEWIMQTREVEPLMGLLHGSNPAYRERAAISLWYLPDPDRAMLRPHLARALAHPLDDLCSFRLESLELLGLAQAFPKSRLACGCKAFGQLRGGSYFGDYLYWSGAGESLSRFPQALPAQWREWLAGYPDHPGADDAAYWLGRTMERQGRRYEAFVFFFRNLKHLPGDQDMQPRWRDHVMWLLDVGVTAQDLEQYLRAYPQDPSAPLVRYALALRRARAHDYSEALRLTEGLVLGPACQASVGEEEWNYSWSLAEPHRDREATFRNKATPDEDLAFQRGLWQRCRKLQGSASARELYALGSFWSEAGGWRIGYFLPLQGQRTFLWCYSWDAYARDSHPYFRPDADTIRDQARLANQNEAIFSLMTQVLERLPEDADPAGQILREKARYTRFAALQAQCTRDAQCESDLLRRDFFREACSEGRLLLRDFPGTPLARDVFLSLSEIQERPGIEHFLELHYPEVPLP